MLHKYLNQDEIEKIIKKYPSSEQNYTYPEVTLDGIRIALDIYLNSKPISEYRKTTIVTWEGGYRLFCEAMEKQGYKI